MNSFFEWVAPNDTVYNVTNSILDMAVSCIPVVGDIRDGVEVITGVSMITGEKLSVAERLITAACFFIPLVGASFVREFLIITYQCIQLLTFPFNTKVINSIYIYLHLLHR